MSALIMLVSGISAILASGWTARDAAAAAVCRWSDPSHALHEVRVLAIWWMWWMCNGGLRQRLVITHSHPIGQCPDQSSRHSLQALAVQQPLLLPPPEVGCPWFHLPPWARGHGHLHQEPLLQVPLQLQARQTSRLPAAASGHGTRRQQFSGVHGLAGDEGASWTIVTRTHELASTDESLLLGQPVDDVEGRPLDLKQQAQAQAALVDAHVVLHEPVGSALPVGARADAAPAGPGGAGAAAPIGSCATSDSLHQCWSAWPGRASLPPRTI